MDNNEDDEGINELTEDIQDLRNIKQELISDIKNLETEFEKKSEAMHVTKGEFSDTMDSIRSSISGLSAPIWMIAILSLISILIALIGLVP